MFESLLLHGVWRLATTGMIQLLKDVREVFLADVREIFLTVQEFQILAAAGAPFSDIRAPTRQLSWPSLMVVRCSVVTAGRPRLSGMLTFPERFPHLCPEST